MQPPSARTSDDRPIETGPDTAGTAATPSSRLFFRRGPGWLDVEGRKVGRERAALDAAQRALAATLPVADAAPGAATIARQGAVPPAGAADAASGPKLFFRSTPGWLERKGGRYRAPLSPREHQLVAETARDTAGDPPAPPSGGSAADADAKEPAPDLFSPSLSSAPSLSSPSSAPASLAVRGAQEEVTETGQPSVAKPSLDKPSFASAPAQAAVSSPVPASESVTRPAPRDAGSASTLTPSSAAAPAPPAATERFPEPVSPEAPPVAAPPGAHTPIPSTPSSAPAPSIADAAPAAAPSSGAVTAEPAAPSSDVLRADSAPPASQRAFSEAAARAPAVVAPTPIAPAAPEPEPSKARSPDPLPSASTAETPAAKPASLSAPRNGQPDDLKVIKGIGPKNEASCYALGVHHIDQIAAWSTANAVWVGHHIAFPGRIEREGWIDQAKLLSIGFDTPHATAVRAGTIVVDEAADAPLSDAEVAALREAMPTLSATLEDEHKYPGMRPVGLAAAHGGVADDLQRIRGIGRQNAARLQALGIWHFVQIAAWTPDHVKWVGSYLAFPGRIAREAWISQAAALAAGGSSGAPKPRDRRGG